MKLNSLVGKIFGRFLLISILMCLAVLFSISSMEKIRKQSESINSTQVPVMELVSSVLINTETSLANLRGLLILGNESFETERRKNIAQAQQQLETLIALLKKNKDKDNASHVETILTKMRELDAVQSEIYEQNKNDNNEPAKKLLDQQFLPRMDKVFIEITDILNHEKGNPGSSIRRLLFSKLADYRGYNTNAISHLKSYLISQIPAEKEAFYSNRKKALEALKWVSNNTSLLSETQFLKFSEIISYELESHFYDEQPGDLFADLKQAESLSEIIFRFRESEFWNRAQYTFKTKAAPLSDSIEKSLKGLRDINSKEVRESLLAQQNNVTSTVILEKWLLVAAVIFAVLISLYLRKAIKGPINRLVSAAEGIAQGDLDQNVELKGSTELEKLSLSFAEMVNNLKHATELTNRLSHGDFNFKVQPKGPK
ncbi:MAG: MCP four helix bundle domain-containing protein, partial [Lentisphaeraceae bacterium]|nr:MCP four helix bundle domain-containing protein [Lentisphaeraceae bacterium]